MDLTTLTVSAEAAAIPAEGVLSGSDVWWRRTADHNEQTGHHHGYASTAVQSKSSVGLHLCVTWGHVLHAATLHAFLHSRMCDLSAAGATETSDIP